jgi:iron complex outermembrane receptor protein
MQTKFAGPALTAITIGLLFFESLPNTYAQTDAAEAASSTGLEEVVVTARKREEKLLETPITVTAFSAAAIEANAIFDLNDIAAYTPGLSITNAGSSRSDRSYQTLIIRGMTPSAGGNTTTVFIDGAPISSGFVSGIDDVERVEVIKGPQSAYFGRETFAGAINLVTRLPSNDFRATIDALYGSDNWRDIRLSLEGPLVQDKVRARISLRDYSQDGQYTNTADPAYKLGDQSTKSVSGTVYLTPTDNLSVKLYGMYWDDNDGDPAVGEFTSAQYNCNAGGAPAGKLNYLCGTLPSFPTSLLGWNTIITPTINSVLLHNSTGILYPLYNDNLGLEHGGLVRNAFHGNLAVNYEIPDWGVTLTSVSAGNFDHVATVQDLDNRNSVNVASPYYGIIPYVQPYDNWLWLNQLLNDDVSQEFRITSDADQRFRWLAGVNYNWTRSQDSASGIYPYGLASFLHGAPTETTTYGAFFGLTYDILENLNINFEGRDQLDEVVLYNRSSTGVETKALSGDFHNFLPRVILQYKIEPEFQVYATYSQGANPGTFNQQFLTQPAALSQYFESVYGVGPTVKPETLDNYELGVKGRFWDGKLQVTADVYYAKWTNQIVSQSFAVPLYTNGVATGCCTLSGGYANIGLTDLDGVEIEGVVQPIDRLVINFAGSMNNSDIRSYACATCTTLTGNPNASIGKLLPNYSKWNGTIGAEWTDKAFDDTNWFAHVDYVYKSGQWDTTANLVETPSLNRVDIRVGLKSNDYRLEFFVLNAFDNKAFTSIENNVDVFSPGFAAEAVQVGMPLLRQFGVRAKYSFGAEASAPPPPAAYVPPAVQAPAPAPSVARSYMVFFDFNKSDLSPQAVAIVDQAARNAAPANATEITVTGHTDTVGSDAYNMRLSRRRAESVAAELEKQGIASSEIEIVAKGKHDLLVPTGDGVREPQNRRVQIVYGGSPTS